MSPWKRLGTAILLGSGIGNFVLKMLFRGHGVGIGVGGLRGAVPFLPGKATLPPNLGQLSF